MGDWILIFTVAGPLLVGIAALRSPWPGVLVIRAVFGRGAAKAAAGLRRHVPENVTTTTFRYDAHDPDAVLDIYRLPGAVADGPVLVWVHGGGFVSGCRQDVANYLKVIAGRGVTVVNVDYSIAPVAKYPTPIRQVNRALAYLCREGTDLGVAPARFVLGGDSAGAQIAAQCSAIISNDRYAREIGADPGINAELLAGTLLFCGVYDLAAVARAGGLLGLFFDTTAWAYTGLRHWRGSEVLASSDILRALTPDFPPTFVSVGNADPLAPQSVALAAALEATGVPVTTLFFEDDHQPAAGHEYQFDLDAEAGRRALAEVMGWLGRL